MARGTVGPRVFEIRAALGRGVRQPMALRAMAELLTQTSGRHWEASKLSLIETNQQRASLDDVEDIAAVDPLKRGKLWLGWGEKSANTKPTKGVPVMPADFYTEPAAQPETPSRKTAGSRKRRP